MDYNIEQGFLSLNLILSYWKREEKPPCGYLLHNHKHPNPYEVYAGWLFSILNNKLYLIIQYLYIILCCSYKEYISEFLEVGITEVF